MYGRNRINSFSLIELLLAMTIFSIVASVIYSSFRLGIISYRRIETNLARYQNIRYAINRFTEDTTNAFMHNDIKFKGEQTKIEFAGYLKDAALKNKTIGRISYTFSGDKLLRQQMPYYQAIKDEPAEAPPFSMQPKGRDEGGEELLSGVTALTITYCYKTSQAEESADLEWYPEWISEKAIPKGIKLELVLKDDYAPQGKRSFSKRIYIPVGEIGNLQNLEK